MARAATSLQRLRMMSIFVFGLLVAGCGLGRHSYVSMADRTGMAPDTADGGQWDISTEAVRPSVVRELGYDPTTHGLRVRRHPNATRAVSLTASSAMHQPTVAATWRAACRGHCLLAERFAGDAPTDVTIHGSEITVTVTNGDRLGNQGWPSPSDAAAVVDGRFAFACNADFCAARLPSRDKGRLGRTDPTEGLLATRTATTSPRRPTATRVRRLATLASQPAQSVQP